MSVIRRHFPLIVMLVLVFVTASEAVRVSGQNPTAPMICNGTDCRMPNDTNGAAFRFSNTTDPQGAQAGSIGSEPAGFGLTFSAGNSGSTGIMYFYLGGATRWVMDPNGLFYPYTSNTGEVGFPSATQGIKAAHMAGPIIFPDLPKGYGSQFGGILTNSAAYAAINTTATKTYFAVAGDGKIPGGTRRSLGETAPYGRLQEPGTRVECDFMGVYGTTGTPTLTFDLDLCTVSGCGTGSVVPLATTGAVTMPLSVTNQGFYVQTKTNIFTVGASGTADTQGWAKYGSAIGTSVQDEMTNTSTATINTTVDEYISPAVTWSASSLSNTITLRNLGCKIY